MKNEEQQKFEIEEKKFREQLGCIYTLTSQEFRILKEQLNSSIVLLDPHFSQPKNTKNKNPTVQHSALTEKPKKNMLLSAGKEIQLRDQKKSLKKESKEITRRLRQIDKHSTNLLEFLQKIQDPKNEEITLEEQIKQLNTVQSFMANCAQIIKIGEKFPTGNKLNLADDENYQAIAQATGEYNDAVHEILTRIQKQAPAKLQEKQKQLNNADIKFDLFYISSLVIAVPVIFLTAGLALFPAVYIMAKKMVQHHDEKYALQNDIRHLHSLVEKNTDTLLKGDYLQKNLALMEQVNKDVAHELKTATNTFFGEIEENLSVILEPPAAISAQPTPKNS